MIKYLNKIINTNLEKLEFENIEKYHGVSEYEFYLINFNGINKNGEKQRIFIRSIKQGKIKESLFCICDLAYEKYLKKLKKISISETNEKSKNINKVSVKLFEDDLNRVKANMEIYFIEMSKNFSKQKIRERIEEIEIDQNDIIIIGVEN